MGLPHVPIALLVMTCIAALAIALTGSMSAAVAGAAGAKVPARSLAVNKFGRCFGRGPKDFSCLSVKEVDTPKAGAGEVLIKTSGSSLNPDELVTLENGMSDYTPGWDVSGVVVGVGYFVKDVKVGDRVYSMFANGGMAEYTTRFANMVSKVPDDLDLTAMGTLPTVAMTSLGAFEAAGAPWAAGSNITVVVVGGSGGTGYTAVQLAKCLGAARVIAGSGTDNVEFVKSLGADEVVDYHEKSVFDAVPDGSVDVVLNNHDSAGIDHADQAMVKLRRGGFYVTIVPGDLAEDPPFGITQVRYSLWAEIGDWKRKLDMITSFISAGKMRIDIQKTFNFDHIRDAFAEMADGHIRSKMSVVPHLSDSFALSHDWAAV